MKTNRTLQIAFSLDGEEVSWRVSAFEITEALSVGCEGWVELESAESVDPASLPGKRCTLKLVSGQGLDRYFQGVVVAAAEQAVAKEIFRVRLDLCARLHLLRMGQDSRLFREKGVKDVVKEVLDQGGLADGAQDWRTAGTYAARDVLRQYNESDEAFVRRLLAEWGVGYAIHHTESEDVVVFFDALDQLTAIDGDEVLWDRAATGTRTNTVWDLEDERRSTPDVVMLRDYDPAKPTLDLSPKEEAPGARGREVYLHPGGFLELSEGKERAKRVLERIQSNGALETGTSDCPMLEPGRTFTLAQHARDALNQSFRVISVTHQGNPHTQPEPALGEVTYQNRFEALPADKPWRPALITARGMTGVEVGFVTGASGAELHGSPRGEVKVRFPWDRSGIQDDKSSPWLRVGQLALGGSMIIPRVGFEVLVDSELGDVDRPMVVGHLYNGEALPPYPLPEGATRSTLQTATTSGGGGANELRFEDAAGSEEIFLNASRDLTMSVENEAVCTIGADEKCEVGGNRTVTIGANHTANVKGSRKLSVTGKQSNNVGGNYTDTVGGSASLDVGAMRKVQVGGDFTEDITGTLERTVGGLQSVTGIEGCQRQVAGNVTNRVGGAWLEVTAGARATTCGPSRKELVGALKMVKAKTIAISCGAAYGMNAASEQVKCGGNRVDEAKAIMINAGGGLGVKAANINITGETKVILRVGGTRIEVTPSTVKVKSAKANLKGTKKLAHLKQHKSG